MVAITHNEHGFVSVVAIELLLLISALKLNRITNVQIKHISHHSTKPMLGDAFLRFNLVTI